MWEENGSLGRDQIQRTCKILQITSKIPRREAKEEMGSVEGPRISMDRRNSTDGRRVSNVSDDENDVEFQKYKVKMPRQAPFYKGLKDAVNEALFSDSPLRHLKNQPPLTRAWLALAYIFPILEWVRSYKIREIHHDIIAGLTIASLCIPQDIGYAKLANLKGNYGLYTSFVPPILYAVFGSSRHIAIGPVAVVSLLLGELLSKEVDPKKDEALYLRLAITSTFFCGVFQAALGLLRLGFVIDFLSHAAVVGFISGAAITIGLQQLKGLLGIKNFTTKTDIVSVLGSVFTHTHQWNWQTIVIGLSFLLLLLTAKYIGKNYKRYFWVSAIAPLVSVILSTLIVKFTRVDKHGVAIVNNIKKGINPSSVSLFLFTDGYAAKAVKIGLVAGLIAFTEAIAIGRTFAALKDYHIDGNKELIAFGFTNIIGSCTSCYVATGSFSRSAVNYNAGARTALSNIVMAIVVMLTLLVLTPLFKYTPNCILSVIIISAVLNLIDLSAAMTLWRVDKLDFLSCMGAFFGVLFISVEYGLLIAVAISFLKIVLYIARPHTAVLGNIPGTKVYRNIEQYPDACTIPGILAVRVDAAVYFCNANYIRERILRLVEDEISLEKSGRNLQYVIIDLTPVTDIDTTGIHALQEFYLTMRKRDLQLVLANPGPVVLRKLINAKFIENIGEEWMFLTIDEATQVCSRLMEKSLKGR